MASDMMILGKRIKHFRISAGMTLEQLGDATERAVVQAGRLARRAGEKSDAENLPVRTALGWLRGVRHFARLLLGVARDDLVVDPRVGLLQAGAELDVWLPAECFLDERVVGVAAVYAFGGVEFVAALELDACDAFHRVHELVDAHFFRAADVDGLDEIRAREHLRAVEAVVDIHEGTRLVAIAPDFDGIAAFVSTADVGSISGAARRR